MHVCSCICPSNSLIFTGSTAIKIPNTIPTKIFDEEEQEERGHAFGFAFFEDQLC